MPHLNHLLEHTARAVVTEFLKGTRQQFVIDVATGKDHIEDSSEPWDSTEDHPLDQLLPQIVGGPHGEKTLQHILTEALVTVAAAHVKHPAKAVERFLMSLRRRSLQEFLHGSDKAVRSKHERVLRSKLAQLGYALRRSLRRDPLREGYGTYHLVANGSGAFIGDVGCDLRSIEQWVTDKADGRVAYGTSNSPVVPASRSFLIQSVPKQRRRGCESTGDTRQLELPLNGGE